MSCITYYIQVILITFSFYEEKWRKNIQTPTKSQTLVVLGERTFDHGYLCGRAWYFNGDPPEKPVTWEDVVAFIKGNFLEFDRAWFLDEERLRDNAGFLIWWISGMYFPRYRERIHEELSTTDSVVVDNSCTCRSRTDWQGSTRMLPWRTGGAMPAPFQWTDGQIEDMISSYESGESLRSIARRYGTSQQVIGPVLKKYSVLLRPHHEATRRHSCDYTYFRTVDTQEKAYWLGFLTADGCITTGNRVAVHLASVDCNHLFKLKKALHASQMVSKNNRSCSLVICSPEMAADLAMHGILPNKTFYTKPARVAPVLSRHYWRGVFDGDGSLSHGGDELALVGDYDVVLGFQAFISSHCPDVRANIRRKENIFSLTIRKQATRLILRVLYEDATVFLDRKYEQARRIIHLT